MAGERWLIVVLSVLSGCAALEARPKPCRPTGWVDRIEGEWAVVDEEGRDDAVLYPVRCFPEPVRPGTRIVGGHIDWAETGRVQADIEALVKALEE